jgi:type VI secretion system protein ImpA
MMTVIDLEPLLGEILPEAPSGETDPGGEFAYADLDRRIKGTPARFDGKKMIEAGKDPNWIEIQKAAIDLLTRAHDLRVAMFLTRALVHTQGLAGLFTGLELISGFVERYWDTVYPQLDPADNNDPTERINILWALDDGPRIIDPLKKAELFSPHTMTRITLRDIHIAIGTVVVKEAAKETALSPSMIDEAFKDCDIEVLQSTRDAITECLISLKRLENLLNQKVGNEASKFHGLATTLEEMGAFFDKRLPNHPSFFQLASSDSHADPEHTDTSSDPPPKSSSERTDKPMEMISNRNDVIYLLDQICLYYDQHEPASPVPLLLKRARQLVEKNFFEIVQDLVPDSAGQIMALIGGATDEKRR